MWPCLPSVLVCFSVAKINHLPKPLGRGSVYLAYMSQSQFIILGTQGKNLEARTEARHHGGMLLTDLQTVASLSCLLQHLGPSVQEFVTTHSGLGPSTLKKMPHRFAYWSIEKKKQLFKMTLACIKFTKTITTDKQPARPRSSYSRFPGGQDRSLILDSVNEPVIYRMGVAISF